MATEPLLPNHIWVVAVGEDVVAVRACCRFAVPIQMLVHMGSRHSAGARSYPCNEQVQSMGNGSLHQRVLRRSVGTTMHNPFKVSE